MKIDICIPTYREFDQIQELINDIEYYTPENHRIIATCQLLSASKNRNYALSFVNSDIIIMLDCDIKGFYIGWLTNLIFPMLNDKDIIICSARLLDENKNVIHQMGAHFVPKDFIGIHVADTSAYKKYKRVATSCIAIRKNNVRFDEGFKGSGYEDTAYMNEINIKYPDKKIVINCNCKLIHMNEEKNQGGEYFKHNRDYYTSLYPDDIACKNMQDYTTRVR